VGLVSVGLVLFALILFAVTLALSFRIPQKFSLHKKLDGPAQGAFEESKQNMIILKLPDNGKYPDNYNIDFKVSLVNHKKNEQDEKENGISEQRKKFYRRLDEFF